LELNKNILYCGDNLKITSSLPSKSVDLIYIDPPFFSNRNYEILWGDEAEIESFKDRWEGGINVYLEWMRDRLIELHRVLKDTGSMYLHCDWHASHYLKVMMDSIFGTQNFQNEIVWCYRGGGVSKKRFARKHDIILFYTKFSNYTFNTQYMPYSEASIKLVNDRGGTSIDGKERDIVRGAHMVDWWVDMNALQTWSPERTGYPTQKPEKLLERIILASSNKGDIILDIFCGCGTTLATADRLGRKWIGVDISPSAVSLIKRRLNVDESIVDIVGMPKSVEDLKKFQHFDFQYWAVNEIWGTPSNKKVGDMGIDGLTFDHYPIQVKQQEHVCRPVIDSFETAIRRYYDNKPSVMKGYIIAFSFTKGAYEEAARAKKEDIDISFITVQNILDRKFPFALPKNIWTFKKEDAFPVPVKDDDQIDLF